MAYRRSIHHSASLDRLEKLIEERSSPGADKETIDQRIWDLFGETWCVMFTDLAGFSRGVAEFGIIHFLQTIHESEKLLVPVIEHHDGILLKIEGDSFLVLFRNATKGLQAAVAMQRLLLEHNLSRDQTEEVLLCVGLGYGRVLRIGDGDVFGAQVNAASKLGEDTAGPREILVTGSIREQVGDLDGIRFEELDNTPPGASSSWRVVWNGD